MGLERAAQLVAKAVDDINAAKKLISEPRQHDNTGDHMARAVEKLAKAYLEASGIQTYPTNGKNGHDLVLLFKMLKEAQLDIESIITLVKLDQYGSRVGYEYTDEFKKVNLKSLLPLIDEFKGLVLRKLKK